MNCLTSEIDLSFKRLLIMKAFWLFFSFGFWFVSAQNEFTLSFTEKNISIYKKKTDNKSFIEYKGKLTIENTDIKTVLKVLKDYKNYQSWIYNCRSAKILKEDNEHIYLYQISKATWPFKDRDYVLCLKPEFINNDSVIIPFSAYTNLISSKKQYTRLDTFNGKWIIKKLGDKVTVSMYGSFDPKMKLPKALRKKYERKIPLKTLSKLKQTLLALK